MNDVTNFDLKRGQIYNGVVGFKIYGNREDKNQLYYGDGEWQEFTLIEGGNTLLLESLLIFMFTIIY